MTDSAVASSPLRVTTPTFARLADARQHLDGLGEPGAGRQDSMVRALVAPRSRRKGAATPSSWNHAATPSPSVRPQCCTKDRARRLGLDSGSLADSPLLLLPRRCHGRLGHGVLRRRRRYERILERGRDVRSWRSWLHLGRQEQRWSGYAIGTDDNGRSEERRRDRRRLRRDGRCSALRGQQRMQRRHGLREPGLQGQQVPGATSGRRREER